MSFLSPQCQARIARLSKSTIISLCWDRTKGKGHGVVRVSLDPGRWRDTGDGSCLKISGSSEDILVASMAFLVDSLNRRIREMDVLQH